LKFIGLLLTVTLTIVASAQTAAPAAVPATEPTASSATAAKPTALLPPAQGTRNNLFSLSYIDIVTGTGDLVQPSIVDWNRKDNKIVWCTVKYTGWLAKDGTQFDSSEAQPNLAPNKSARITKPADKPATAAPAEPEATPQPK
jgi:FKBP-type peptidyl-prolyl cis-trans isomerase